MFVALVI